ncbi:GntR family transcriptional regulator [Jannaschia sp. M317]|uniref:GntR family transcriptional regulator n=1 Tax=Jannaschia sp. M317 TaxID=2867011 RepID=UPI0021A58048|nr:GntR family transcriptional regulator [Jannaschia sp. M317]UWQ18053.1 GntR family transcriptional regulator [Jannaschia sp. M317]
MSRSSSTFKEGYNRALDMIGSGGVDWELPTEVALAKKWSVSRTTVRSILQGLQDVGIITWSGRSKTVLRKPRKAEYFPADETESVAEKLPSLFMEHIFAGELTPGTTLRETELAKAFGVSSTAVREFLIRFSRFGLIEKKPNRHWVLNGFTRDFAEELFAVRAMFERTAFAAFLAAGKDTHQRVIDLREEHEMILADITRNYVLFPRLDEKFHRTWIDAFGNRFVRDFFELISLVFHYHYRWNKRDELERNHHAVIQHLAIISALEAGDADAADRAMNLHLTHARETLLSSATWDGST